MLCKQCLWIFPKQINLNTKHRKKQKIHDLNLKNTIQWENKDWLSSILFFAFVFVLSFKDETDPQSLELVM